jgi:hypothetical protein
MLPLPSIVSAVAAVVLPAGAVLWLLNVTHRRAGVSARKPRAPHFGMRCLNQLKKSSLRQFQPQKKARLLASINDTATLAFWRWWGSFED